MPAFVVLLNVMGGCVTPRPLPTAGRDESCHEGSDEERRRCLVDALATCRMVAIEAVDPGGPERSRVRIDVVPGQESDCEVMFEYWDSNGLLKRRVRCGAIEVKLDGFELGPMPAGCR